MRLIIGLYQAYIWENSFILQNISYACLAFYKMVSNPIAGCKIIKQKSQMKSILRLVLFVAAAAEIKTKAKNTFAN